MSSWAERLETAIGKWRQGDLDGAAAATREIVVAGDGTVNPEASHVLGHVLRDAGDLEGARAAHRSVVATGHPLFAQRSAIALGVLLVDEEQWALAHRPLVIASAGADAEIAVMADIALVSVLRRLGGLDASAAALDRARRSGNPEAAELAEGLEIEQWPDDGGERERQAWEAFEAMSALLDEGGAEAEEAEELVVSGLDRMLHHGVPELCSQAAFRLYSIFAERGEFGECRRVVEHAIAVGDPAEAGIAEKLLGAVLFDLGEHAESREAYRRAAEDHRPEVRLDALIQESKFARDHGDEEESRAILRRVVDSGHPAFGLEARACLGQVYSEAGEVDDAIACWRVVLGTGSRFHRDAVYCLGMLLHGLPGDDPRRTEIIALLQLATELDDSDVAFQAQLTILQAAQAVRGPDEAVEQAIDDCDAALDRLRDGDLEQARALLRRVIDAEIEGHSGLAARTLALLELAEGDLDQAEELLSYVADGADFANGFAAAVDRHLMISGHGGGRHPVLAALIDYQRLGRETGVARYRECAGHPDPAVAALAKSTLAQVYISLGVPRSQGVELFDEAAAAGDPLALSHAAVLSWIIRGGDEVVGLLSRAHADGHPVLAPWVAQALGTALEAHDADEALAAYDAVSRSGHPGLGFEAETRMLHILEARDDLAGVASVHERGVARGDRLRASRSAWLLGFTRVRLDDFAAARAAYSLVAEDHPELAEDGLFARRLLDRDFEGAAAALAANPKDGEGHGAVMTTWLAVEAAHAWRRAGDTAAADAALSLVIAGGHPDRVQEAALFLGALRNDHGDLAGAAEAWARAAAGDDARWAKLGAEQLGEARYGLGDLDGAVAAYRQAFEATGPDDDDFPQAMDSVTRALIAAGRVTEAWALQTERSSEGPQVGLRMGAALEEAGDLGAAVAAYRAAAEGESGDAEAVALACAALARLLAAQGETAQAIDVAERAVACFEQLAEAGAEGAVEQAAVTAYELAGYLADFGDVEGAREAYERATGSSDLAIRLAARERLGTADLCERAFLRLGEDDRAGALELLAREYGTPVIAELRLALFERRLPAVRLLLESPAATGHERRAGQLLADAALEGLQEGSDAADELYALVLEFGLPEHVAVVCDGVGQARDLAGDTTGAVEALQRGAGVDHPSALACLRRLLGLLAMMGDHAAHAAAAQRAIESGDPETITLGVWTQGGLAKDRGDIAGAVAKYREAIESAAPDAVPYIQVELGQALNELGEKSAAHRAMESVLTCDNPGQALIAGVHLGAWLGQDGRLAGAAEAFGAAAAAGLRLPDPEEDDREVHQMALNNLAAVAHQADGACDYAVAVRALHLAAAGGAPADAARIAREGAEAAAGRGDLNAARTYYKGAAGFPPDGDATMLLQLAEVLADHGGLAEAQALLEPLASSADPHLRLAATAQLLPILQDAGEDDRALEVAARAAGQAVPSASEEPEPDEEEPSELDSMRWVMRNQAGTATAGAAGRQLIRAARDVMDTDLAQAHEILELVVEYGDPEEVATAYDDIGDLHGYHQNDMAAAIEAYRKGAAVDHPAALLPLRSLMMALIEVADHDGVAEVAQRAVTSGDPETVAVGYWLWGDSRGNRGDTDAAARLYRQGIEVGHAEITPRIRFDLALTLNDRGLAAEARAELRVAADAAETALRVRAGSLLGKWAFEDGDLGTAAEAFGQVGGVTVGLDDPDSLSERVEMAVQNLFVIANTAFSEGEHQVAVRALTLAARTGRPEDALTLAGKRATELIETGDRTGAVPYIEGAAGLVPDPGPDLAIQLADLFAAAGRPDEARDRYERLTGHHDAEVRLVAAGRLAELEVTERPADGAAEVDHAPGAQALLSSMLGVVQSEQGDDEAAMRTLRTAARSGEPASLFTLGQALLEAGEVEEAREVLASVIEADSGLGRRAIVLLGQSHHDQDADRARELYLRALQAPGEPDPVAEVFAKMYLGALAKRNRDWPEALRWYQRVIDSGDQRQAPLAAAHLGELAYWLGDRDAAVRFYELTLATGTLRADLVGEAAYRLGEIRHGDGDLDSARAHLRRAIESGDEAFAEPARTLLGKDD